MLELFELLQKLIHEPLRAGTLIAVVLFLIDRLFKQLFIRHVRKLLHIRDRNGVELHMQKLLEIEQKLNLLLKDRGIEEWDARSITKDLPSTVQRKNVYSWLFATIKSNAGIVGSITPSMEGRKPMKLNKVLLIPVLAAIATLIKEIYGYEIGSEYVDMAATAIIWIIGAAGIFMHPHAKEPIDNEISRTLEHSE